MSAGASPPGLRMAATLSTWLPSVWEQGQRPLASLPLLMGTPVLSDLRPTLRISWSLNYLFKGPISEDSHIRG